MTLDPRQKRIRNVILIIGAVAVILTAILLFVIKTSEKSEETDAYLNYVEWNPPFTVHFTAVSEQYVGYYRHDGMRYDIYYTLHDLDASQIIMVDRVENGVTSFLATHEKRLYYPKDAVCDPQELLKPKKASLSLWHQSENDSPLTMMLSDSAYLSALTDRLFEASPISKDGLNLSVPNQSAKMTVYLDSSESVSIVFQLCSYQGEWHWRVNGHDDTVYVVPLDAYMKDLVEHGFDLTKE